ncbi:galactose/methyl galactoside import ATP-binding protein MglA [Clostridiales bacterium]|nr:galactose/methyl galactoside import ATP-binding protein MglA [Clostridiales bacterium]
MEQQTAIRMQNITKTFGQVLANHNITIDIHKGEILSLLGENGSGKTTLMNMLSGIYYPDAGKIYVNGEAVSIRSPEDAFACGIGMIHQHFKLIDVFTAAENVVLGLHGKNANLKNAVGRIRDICEKYGFEMDPSQKVYNMSVSQKQTLEIIKVLYRGADILILDEPTAVLTPQETEHLFHVIRNMKKVGKAVVIITHKLHEVLSVSDRVTILRRGEYVDTVPTADATVQSLAEMMVGKKIVLDIERPPVQNPKKCIEVKGLTVENQDGVRLLDNVSFTANSGEILGIAGISGCGQKELLESIAGLQKVSVGTSILYTAPDTDASVELVGKNPKQIREMGISLSFVPEDRLGMGLVGAMGMTDNMMLKNYRRGHTPFAERREPRKLAEKIREELEVATPGINVPVRRLSGGNVQKVLVGREIAAAPTVLMTAYAVRGLDIHTSYTIYHLLNEQKKAGVAVIYVGEDLDVLLELCDRILVLCAGHVNGILDGASATKEEVGMLMTHLQEEGGSDAR